MPAPESIKQLVEKFKDNREAYRSGKYNEAQLRQQFLDPFFESLGWDIYNRAGVSPEYQDVKIEDSLRIDGASKAPDYTFRIGKERKFYVEAKKPAVDIQYDIHPAYQLKRYAWNAHLPLSILTDFEEFAVYNCKNKPNPSDSAATGRDLFYKYTDYVDKWDEISAIFSREAVWKGSFDRYAETSKGKKGTTEVDDAILESIESWRKLLALNIALRNEQVREEGQLNFAVQMTIDRILFLRICEDRGIEPEEQFKNMLEKPGIYSQMVELFKRADMKYNSGLFHFSHEKDSTSAADTFTPGLTIDDKVLKEIIKDIYYPCPYIFKEIPVEILGQVYEQFLGKVIHMTPGGHARVEEKPEVRKAGGVYYTPKYIVDYIVENTLGKLLESKTPIEAAELKVVDPACGSGSFLLGPYQYLLDWHLKWYLADGAEKWAKGKTPALVASDKGSYKLTTAKKKEILVNNIHGVDIDPQAVEVTKLSLLLKVLEEETGQLSLGLERALPDLGRNIQCGNSLIGEDYFAGQLIVDEKERQRVNPFDWERAFPTVFASGASRGFDAVIGNPPYVFGGNYGIETDSKKYFSDKYFSGSGKVNLFGLFIEKSITVLQQTGLLSFIIPNTILRVTSYAPIREFILNQTAINKITDLGAGVFEGATTSSTILVLEKNPKKLENLVEISNGIGNIISNIFQKEFMSEGFVLNIFASVFDNKIINNMKKCSTPLGDLCDELIFGVVITKNREKVVSDKPLPGYKPFLEGKDITRYKIHPTEKYLLYDPKQLHRPRTPKVFEVPEKIIIQRITGGLSPLKATYDNKQYYNKESLNNVIIKNDTQYKTKYVLGLINSKLINWFYRTSSLSKLIVRHGMKFAPFYRNQYQKKDKPHVPKISNQTERSRTVPIEAAYFFRHSTSPETTSSTDIVEVRQ